MRNYSPPAKLIEQVGAIDVSVANLAVAAPSTPAEQVTDEEWRAVFAALVDPLPRLCRAVLPMMQARGAGKILVIGSASALRGMKRASIQCSPWHAIGVCASFRRGSGALQYSSECDCAKLCG